MVGSNKSKGERERKDKGSSTTIRNKSSGKRKFSMSHKNIGSVLKNSLEKTFKSRRTKMPFQIKKNKNKFQKVTK